MSRKYKFCNPDGVYFVSFSTVYWIDVFIRDDYFIEMINALDFFRKHKGMKIYGYCIMPSHVHLLFSAENSNPSALLRDFKKFTARRMLDCIRNNIQESRKSWLLWMFKRAGEHCSNVKHYQFWQHSNHPIEIHSDEFFEQKLEYIHQNPVASGFVMESEGWKYSSARNYAEVDFALEIDYLV
ncbi:transposase [Bisgaard Taxon 10/6]|uniref:Transposase n=1 Tax=Exercitatus varius TaxID=67857 RepID=A0ABT6ESL1_9PAST|nr:transposase [Exercitatus varius]MDG2939839.1 transposase [Exercitatus varius]MDG2942082.1 transposase [Exercitatus varius]MDG2946523.1 transposase [Exercitatus varius]